MPYKPKDLSGRRFGNLIAISCEKVGRKYRWLCQCDCGVTTRVQADNLNNGHTSSCGCKRRKKRVIERKRGYKRVSIGRKVRFLHRLVYCEANGVSIESIDGLVVRHKCDNPRCINAEHLEIGSQADNTRDRVQRGRSWSKLTKDQVAEIRAAYVPGSKHADQAALARRYGIAQQHISRIIRKENHK